MRKKERKTKERGTNKAIIINNMYYAGHLLFICTHIIVHPLRFIQTNFHDHAKYI